MSDCINDIDNGVTRVFAALRAEVEKFKQRQHMSDLNYDALEKQLVAKTEEAENYRLSALAEIKEHSAAHEARASDAHGFAERVREFKEREARAQEEEARLCPEDFGWQETLAAVRARVATLEAALRDAPHQDSCWGTFKNPPNHCTCWKRAALAGKP